MKSARADAALAVAILFLGFALACIGCLLAEHRSGSTWLTLWVGLGTAVVGTLVFLWWMSSFCLAVIAEVLSRRGYLQSARRAATFAPAFMRRTACLALGLNLAVVPATHAATDDFAGATTSQQVAANQETPPLNPQWIPIEQRQTLEPTWRPTVFKSGGSLMVKEPREHRSPAGGEDREEVIVQPGDSLWTIAARHLGQNAPDASVAEAWPRWYEANRLIIGENPELLLPGQVLYLPASTAAESK